MKSELKQLPHNEDAKTILTKIQNPFDILYMKFLKFILHIVKIISILNFSQKEVRLLLTWSNGSYSEHCNSILNKGNIMYVDRTGIELLKYNDPTHFLDLSEINSGPHVNMSITFKSRSNVLCRINESDL